MTRYLCCLFACLLVAAASPLWLLPATAAKNPWVVLHDDGGWCWFEDLRVVVDGGKLVAGTVANGSHDPARKGDIEVVRASPLII